jgi:glycosyltransferase involved in cell wall biosynthesis
MDYRPKLVFCAPVATVSGYGAHSRDLLLSLIKMDKFDISVIGINWGETPMNALDENNPEHKQILDLISDKPMTSQPDIWMQCTIPNEFQPVGKYNIGITAGVETDICSPEWIDGCNKMNLVIVPSKHAKNVFMNTNYEKRDKTSNQTIGNLSIKVPIEVLHEGVRLEIYGKDNKVEQNITETLDQIDENFVYLFVGHWLKGDFGQDRKDISGLIYTFIETFSNKPNKPALLLKASAGTFSVSDRSRVMEKINLIKHMTNKKDIPNIYLLHGDLTDNEMNTLYNHDKIKALVSFTKGEGYGRPIAEFITSGKPVLVSDWSGHTDFVSKNFHTLLKGEVKPVHKSAIWEGIINEGSSWFTVDYQNAAIQLDKVFNNYQKYHMNSKRSVREIEKLWSFESMHNKFDSILENSLPKFSKKLELNLPQLKKLPTLKKIVLNEEGI